MPTAVHELYQGNQAQVVNKGDREPVERARDDAGHSHSHVERYVLGIWIACDVSALQFTHRKRQCL